MLQVQNSKCVGCFLKKNCHLNIMTKVLGIGAYDPEEMRDMYIIDSQKMHLEVS